MQGTNDELVLIACIRCLYGLQRMNNEQFAPVTGITICDDANLLNRVKPTNSMNQPNISKNEREKKIAGKNARVVREERG